MEKQPPQPSLTLGQKIRRLESRLESTMLRDREALARRLTRIRSQSGKGRYAQLNALEKRLEESVRERNDRLARVPRVAYPESLPITAKRDEIIDAIRSHQVVILSGETGCGKSTQIPKMCLEAGRGIGGKIGCTQPRRIAASTIARRVAEELGEPLGKSVGYKIRFTDHSTRESYIKVMTDGILLAETQGDRRLLEYDTLVIDEAHERSLNIDFLLGILRTLLPERPELKVIISSATLDTEKFMSAFEGAPAIVVEGRTYPVEVEYLPLDPEQEEAGEITYVDMAVQAVDRIQPGKHPGDILIFMPTEQDVLETCERLEGRSFSGVTVLPLYARLPASEQDRVYGVKGRKIVAATNVAETSLTIPGIRYVIDSGLARISRYQPRTRTRSLPVSPISRASADQRKGRCGRVQKGVCIRLYSEEDYLSRAEFTPPEILRSNLAEVTLRMLYLDLGHPSSFPFLDKPHDRSVKDGFDLLVELGAIEKRNEGYALTETGKIMARTPLDPRISRMMVEASKEGCMEEMAVIAAGLSIQDPRERPADKAKQADQMTAPFKHPESDFLTLLNIWNRYHREWETLKSQNKMRKFCKSHFLSFSRMREWVFTREQIMNILRDQRLGRGAEKAPDLYAGIHRSVLSGFLSNIAQRKGKNIYLAAKGREVMIFPGSTLFNKKAPWIVAAEMVKTSRLFARSTAQVDPEWLERIGKEFCKYAYFEPHWEKDAGEVRAWEQVTLFGLPIVSRRPVPYGPVNPEEAHGIFVQGALLLGEMKERFPFLDHNRKLLQKLGLLEDKLRRRDIVASDPVLEEFYSARLQSVYDVKGLRKSIQARGGDHFLRLQEEDLLLVRPDEELLSQFPDRVTLGEETFRCAYKFAPAKPEDGVTVRIPAGLITRLPTENLEWGVPGLFREKLTALIKGLPKRYRRQLVPVSGTVELLLRELEPKGQSFLNALSELVFRRFGVDIPASVWASVEIPDYLRTRVSIVDHRGKEIDSSRDVGSLKATDQAKAHESDSVFWKRARAEWERSDLSSWEFEEIPEKLLLHDHLFAYPGLQPKEKGVDLKLFPSLDEALESHSRGVEALMSLQLSKDLKLLKRNLSLTPEGVQYARYFGGAPAVERDLFEALKAGLFRKNIRTKKSFTEETAKARSEMAREAVRLRDQAGKTLQPYFQTRQTLHGIETAHKANPAVLNLCAHIRRELDALVPEHFLLLYPPERMAQLPRYIRALQIRAERGANDPGKDRSKWDRAEPILLAFKEVSVNTGPPASRQKREALETLRWMVEEYKVSVFAQELKTAFPVSAKRLEEKIGEIQRMI
jgi:ATP-dependent helicase HrpA